MDQQPLLSFFTFIFLASISFGMGYYYVYEVAPACTVRMAGADFFSQECKCQGIEVDRYKNLDRDGAKVTICLGRTAQMTCYDQDDLGVYEVECR